MSGLVQRLFYEPLNRGHFAYRFLLIIVVASVLLREPVDNSLRQALLLLLKIYLISITARRCRDFKVGGRTKTWTHIGLRKESMMYSEEQSTKALHIFHQTGSVTDVVRRLGYPSRKQLYTWIRNERKTKEKRKNLILKTPPNTPEIPRRSLSCKCFVVALRMERV